MTGLRPYSSWADFKASSDFNPVLATDVYSPNGTVASVKFYAGTGTGYLLGTATYADDNGNWTIDVSPSSLGGATSVTIVVADSEGVTNGSSGTTFSISPVSLGQITVDTGDGNGPTTTPVYTSGTSVSISVASVLTTNSGATIAGVKFYLDTSGTGIYNPGTVQLLTGTLTSNGTGGYALSGVNTSGWIGDQTIFAVAYDSAGATNCPETFLVSAKSANPPQWGSLGSIPRFNTGGDAPDEQLALELRQARKAPTQAQENAVRQAWLNLRQRDLDWKAKWRKLWINAPDTWPDPNTPVDPPTNMTPIDDPPMVPPIGASAEDWRQFYDDYLQWQGRVENAFGSPTPRP